MPSLEELLLAGEHGSPALGALGHLFQQLPAGAGFFGGQEYAQGQQDRSVIRDQLEKQRQRQAQFEAERAALGPGAPPEAMSGLALKYAGPQDLLKYADDYQKLAEAKRRREAQQAGLTAIIGGDQPQISPSVPAGPQPLGINFPVGGAPDTPSPTISPNSPEYIAKRVKQLDALSVLYADNSPAVTAIARERDKLLAIKESVPSVHIVQDKTSPTGWSYGDAKQEGKILMRGAPAPASAAGSEPLSGGDLKSIGAEIATGKPIIQVIPGMGRQYSEKRLQGRQEAINQIKEETGMNDQQAGVELANRSVDYLAGRRTTTQLSLIRGMTDQAVGQLDFNIKKATEAMDKLPSTDLTPILNAIARGEQKWTGNPAYYSLFFFMSAAAQESAKILAGGVGSVQQLHQGAQEEAKRWMSVNMTPASWKEGVAPAMLAEGHARLRTFDEAIRRQRTGGATRAVPEAPSVGNKPAPPPGFTPL